MKRILILIILIIVLLSYKSYSNTKIKKTTTGTISGHFGYPSEGIPNDLKIYAENINTGEKYIYKVDKKSDKYSHFIRPVNLYYEIEVPIGQYYVYAMTNYKTMIGYKAYYSEFVTCGLKYKCPSHKPIIVDVEAGKKCVNIDPMDWYRPRK